MLIVNNVGPMGTTGYALSASTFFGALTFVPPGDAPLMLAGLNTASDMSSPAFLYLTLSDLNSATSTHLYLIVMAEQSAGSSTLTTVLAEYVDTGPTNTLPGGAPLGTTFVTLQNALESTQTGIAIPFTESGIPSGPSGYEYHEIVGLSSDGKTAQLATPLLNGYGMSYPVYPAVWGITYRLSPTGLKLDVTALAANLNVEWTLPESVMAFEPSLRVQGLGLSTLNNNSAGSFFAALPTPVEYYFIRDFRCYTNTGAFDLGYWFGDNPITPDADGQFYPPTDDTYAGSWQKQQLTAGQTVTFFVDIVSSLMPNGITGTQPPLRSLPSATYINTKPYRLYTNPGGPGAQVGGTCRIDLGLTMQLAFKHATVTTGLTFDWEVRDIGDAPLYTGSLPIPTTLVTIGDLDYYAFTLPANYRGLVKVYTNLTGASGQNVPNEQLLPVLVITPVAGLYSELAGAYNNEALTALAGLQTFRTAANLAPCFPVYSYSPITDSSDPTQYTWQDYDWQNAGPGLDAVFDQLHTSAGLYGLNNHAQFGFLPFWATPQIATRNALTTFALDPNGSS